MCNLIDKETSELNVKIINNKSKRFNYFCNNKIKKLGIILITQQYHNNSIESFSNI